MTHILVVKTSSMGDVIHTLPAVTDASRLLPGITFDWVVEESFQDIPASHTAVQEVIPVALRRWRKHITAALVGGEFRLFRTALKRNHYDLVIDAQGLMKSALITRLAGARSVGLNWQSAREPICSLFYQQKVEIPRKQHAVERIRLLFAEALNYSVPEETGRYGISADTVSLGEGLEKYRHTHSYTGQILFLHGTAWESKHWPIVYWQQLAEQVIDSGYRVLLPWGDEKEKQQAELIASGKREALVLPRLNIRELMGILAFAEGVVSGDTGLGHLAVACEVPTIAIYGPTNPSLTGSYGVFQENIVSDHLPCIPCMKRVCKIPQVDGSPGMHPPCFQPLTPASIWSELLQLIHSRSEHEQSSG